MLAFLENWSFWLTNFSLSIRLPSVSQASPARPSFNPIPSNNDQNIDEIYLYQYQAGIIFVIFRIVLDKFPT